MKLVRTVRKFLTIKRNPKRKYHLIDGPMNGSTMLMSYSGRRTLIFSYKGYIGRYVSANENSNYGTNLIWEDHSND